MALEGRFQDQRILKFISKSGSAVYHTFCRFPLTILLFISLAALTIYHIEVEVPYEKLRTINEIVNRLSAVLVLGISLSLSVQVLLERIRKKPNYLTIIGIYVLETAILILYFRYLFPTTDMVPVVRLVLITFSLLLSFLFIPYFLNKENFEIYITKVITRIIISAIFTIVLALGLMATLFAIKSLLYNNMSENYYIYNWILAWLIFAPIHFLFGFPKINDNFSLDDYNKILKILLLYIILPVLSIYTVVLYIYFAKIIITQIWPKGIVSYLVLSYSAVGIMTVFLLAPLKQESKWAKIFIMLFTKLVFPLLAMMFVSIGIRLNDYGFTENRYFILIAGLWATLAMLFINFLKSKKNILLFISLAIIALFTVAGPVSAFNVSILSQNQRFFNILEKYNMIQGGKVVNRSINVESKDQIEINAIVHYFSRYHELSELKYLPEGFSVSKMKDVFGFETNYANEYLQPKRRYFYYNKPEKEPIIISGYNILFEYQVTNQEKEILFSREINSEYGNTKALIDNKYVLTLLLNNNHIYKIDLADHVKNLNSKYGDNKALDIPEEEITLISGNDKAEVMLIFNYISGYQDINSELSIDNLQGKILIKLLSHTKS